MEIKVTRTKEGTTFIQVHHEGKVHRFEYDKSFTLDEALEKAADDINEVFEEKENEFKFQVGDTVAKVTGDYCWEGEVVAAFKTPNGFERYVVAHEIPETDGSGYVLHIYGPNNLGLIT